MSRFLRFMRPSPAMIVALLALFIATSSTATASSLLTIAKNSITSKQVKDHSLLAKDFKAGQLPAGPAGPAGPQGAAGAAGAQGPQGLAGSARAYTFVKVDSPGQPVLFRNKGFSNVRMVQLGMYCLTAPGLDPTTTMHMAGQFTDGNQYYGATVSADGGGQQCGASEFQVNTIADDGNYVNVLEFWVAVP